MIPFLNEPVATKITAVVFVPAGGGAPVHKDRQAHGLAFNTSHTSTYRFSDGKVLTCHSGQCIYLPKGCSYTVDRTESSEDPSAGVHAINFLLEAPLEETPVVIPVRSQAAFLSAFHHAREGWRQKRSGYRELCFAQLYTLLGILAREQEGYTSRLQTRRVLAPALEYIDENFTKRELPTPELAALCGISEQYLRRLFRSAFGMPPARYVRHLRLRYARELLETGEYSVADAAAEAGFNDTAYFSREFKETFGISPGRFGSGSRG